MLLGACGTPYVFNGISYSAADDALAAQDAFHRDLLPQVPRKATPEFGTVAVILPTRQLIRERGIAFGVPKPSRGQIDYLAEAGSRGLYGMVDMLRARNSFAAVLTQENDQPRTAAMSAVDGRQAALFVEYPEKGVAVWMLAKSARHEPVPVNIDSSATSGMARVMMWLQGIERAMH